MKSMLVLFYVLWFSHATIAIAQIKSPKLLSQTAKSMLIDNLAAYCKKDQLSSVIKELVPIVNKYLQGKELKPEQFHLVFNHNMLFPAAIARNAYGDFFIFLNHERFDKSIAVKIYEDGEIEHAKIICIFHELVHAWQVINIPKEQRSIFKMEGHAVFLQSIFAKDYGLEQINKKGIKAFSQAKKISFVIEHNIFSSWLVKKYVEYFYLRSQSLMARTYRKIDLKQTQRLNEASHRFFSNNSQ